MPNIGKPSQDCQLCRRRRVKCDLARPSCQRCVKYGAQCPGYRDMKNLVFRNTYSVAWEGSRIGTRPHSARKSRVSADYVAALSAESHLEPNGVSSSTWVSCDLQHMPSPSPTLTSVKENWTMHSIPLMMECFSSVRFFTCLLENAPENHPLILVSHVFARTYMVNRYNAPLNKKEVSTYLGKALQAIQATINDASRCKEDATIVAVWLLGIYEILVGRFEKRGSDVSAWLVHSAGLTSLLRHRGPHNLTNPLVRQMFWVTYNTIQIQCMISNIQCPVDLTVWLDGLEGYLAPEEEPLLIAAKFIRNVCLLFELAIPIIVNAKFAQACEIYPHFMCKFKEAEAISPCISQQAGVNIRQNFWTSWCSTKIKLNYIVILISGLVEQAPNSPYSPDVLAWQRNACRDDTARISADIINSLPVSLGGLAVDSDLNSPSAGYTGIRLVWPLSLIYMLPTVPTQHRVAAKDALLKVGRDIGVLQALRGYTARKKYPSEVISDIKLDEGVSTDGYLPDICSSTSSSP